MVAAQEDPQCFLVVVSHKANLLSSAMEHEFK